MNAPNITGLKYFVGQYFQRRVYSTRDVENNVVHTQGTVFPALTFTVHHDLHDLSSQRDAGGVEAQTGGVAVTCLEILS